MRVSTENFMLYSDANLRPRMLGVLDIMEAMLAFKSLSEPRVRLADKVYDQIMQAIHDGTISPDDRIVQEKLAIEFEISRTPIREALFRMEQEGILKVAGRGGFVIRMPDAEEIAEMYDSRCAIEAYSARLLAEENNPGTIKHLRQVVQKEESLKDATVKEYFLANRAIHRAFVEACGNRFLLEFFDNIWSRGTSYTLFASIKSQSLAKSLGDHMALVDAIESGDGCKAAEDFITHIRDGQELQRSS